VVLRVPQGDPMLAHLVHLPRAMPHPAVRVPNPPMRRQP